MLWLLGRIAGVEVGHLVYHVRPACVAKFPSDVIRDRFTRIAVVGSICGVPPPYVAFSVVYWFGRYDGKVFCFAVTVKLDFDVAGTYVFDGYFACGEVVPSKDIVADEGHPPAASGSSARACTIDGGIFAGHHVDVFGRSFISVDEAGAFRILSL